MLNKEQALRPNRAPAKGARRLFGSAILMLSLAGCGAASADNGIPASGPAATPTPYQTATATPEATAIPYPMPTATTMPQETPTAPTYPGGKKPDVELKPGFCVQAPANSVVEGDVQINGQPFYDNIATTGLIVEMDKGGEVCAPFGADVQFVGKDNMASVIGSDTELMKHPTADMLRRGHLPCGSTSGCDSVIVKKFPGDS